MFNLIKKNPWLLLATGIAAIGVAIADTLGAFDKWLGTEDEVQEETDKTTDSINELNDALLNVDKTLNKVSGKKGTIKPIEKIETIPTLSIKPIKTDLDEVPAKLQNVADLFGNVVTQQDRMIAASETFKNVFSSAMTSAAYSQEGFFTSFMKNLKQAIKQMLIQLAITTAINFMFGGKGFKVGDLKGAFSAAKDSLIGLASGGLVTGPTMALVGEGAGTTASNPEVVAPLDKLKGMINGGGTQQVEVFGRISGNDIFLANQRGSINRFRSV